MNLKKYIKDNKLIKKLELLEPYIVEEIQKGKKHIIKFNIQELNNFLFLKDFGFNYHIDSTRHHIFDFNDLRIISTGKKQGNANSKGKELADAAELATILSLTKEIKIAADTEQDFFIKNPQYFSVWYNTFQLTKPAIEKIVGNIRNFEVIHDATDKGPLSKITSDLVKKGKPFITTKDAWCPADLFLIKKTEKTRIFKELNEIIKKFDKDVLLLNINSYIYKEYQSKNFYPISLKQISGNKAQIEFTNIPDKNSIPLYDIDIEKIDLNLFNDSKEIGLFKFNNNITNKNIVMQVRGFPHGYRTAQTEITNDGSKTGGRVGKIPTNIIDIEFDKFNKDRIKSMDYFGKSPNYFSNFDDKKIKEFYEIFKKVSKNSKVNQKNISEDEFKKLINEAKNDINTASNMSIKLQGLKFIEFFVENNNKISEIIGNFINGAKKIGKYNAFFIKIY